MKTKYNPSILLVARVSDVSQIEALPAQKKRLDDYAKSKSWKEDVDFKYVEFDETAFKKNRKTFNELVIEPLQKSTEPSIVVFDKIDRFSRDSSSKEKAELTKLYESGKLEMHFPSDNLFIHKDSPAADRFRLDIGISLAAYYSSAIRDNVKRRFEELLSKGVWVHRAPVGYKNIAIETDVLSKPIKDIVIDIDRAHFVVQAFEWRAQGMPYGQIAKRLIEAGYTSRKTGKQKISKSDIEKMINNKFYFGIMTHDGKEYKHKYQSLILGSIEALVKKIIIPEHLIEKVIDELKKNHDDQQQFYTQSISSVRSEYDEIDKKKDMWFEKLVDEKVKPEQYDRIIQTLTNRQEQLNDKLDILTKGNKDFLVTASYLLDLVGRADELFKLADEGQRSKLIGFLVSNLQLNNKKLSFTVNYPFNELIETKQNDPEGSKSQIWCG